MQHVNEPLRVQSRSDGRLNELWRPPESGWTKGDSNKTSKGNLDFFGARYVARDDAENILMIGEKWLPFGTNNEAEIMVSLLAM